MHGDAERCQAWVDSHDPPCDESVIRAIDPDDLGPNCPPGEDCDNAAYQYYGHGSSDLGESFASHVAELCLTCDNVDASLSGCQLFDDVAAMQSFIDSLQLPCGASLTMEGSQCNVPVGQEACMPGACTFTYGCQAPEFAPCSQTEGRRCSYPGETVQCSDDSGGPTCAYDTTLTCINGTWTR